jgi:diguanylate cyclase (GGDEF)-like protein
VLDSLGALLKAYAHFAFDSGPRAAADVREELMSWHRHITLGAPRPGTESAPGGAALGQRDWNGLVREFTRLRREEAEHTQRSSGDFRETIWAFASAINEVVRDEAEAAQLAEAQLERVRIALESRSTELLRTEALASVEVLAGFAQRCRQRHRERFVELAARIKALTHDLEEARRESTVDALTGLANRKAFETFAQRSLDLHALLGQPATLLMIDLDQFKRINDTHGHPIGDLVLRAVSDCLSRVFMRRCDFVCRYGGDEFVVILHETALANGLPLAHRLIDTVHAARLPDELHGAELGLSIGVAEIQAGESAASWVRRADVALYQAKQDGRGRVVAAS